MGLYFFCFFNFAVFKAMFYLSVYEIWLDSFFGSRICKDDM